MPFLEYGALMTGGGVIAFAVGALLFCFCGFAFSEGVWASTAGAGY
jgi:hypothetical protein